MPDRHAARGNSAAFATARRECIELGYCPIQSAGCEFYAADGKQACRNCSRLNTQQQRDYWARRRARESADALAVTRSAALRVRPRGFRTASARTVVARASAIRLHALTRAGGVCECGCGVSFEWLDVHHIHGLSSGGLDDIYNAIALRPDCHRRAERVPDFNATLLQRMEVLEP